MLYRFKDFVSETFHPRGVQSRDPKMDNIIKQKEESGQVYVDYREWPAVIVRESDNANIPVLGSITIRNPWSTSIQFKKDNNVLCEFVFYLHAIFADARKKNLYEPYKLDDMEIQGRSKKYKIIYDDNVDKLVENMCKLIYNKEIDSAIKKSQDLKKDVIEMALTKTLFIEKNNLPS